MSLPKLDSKIRESSEKEIEKIREEGKTRIKSIKKDATEAAKTECDKITKQRTKEIQKRVDEVLSNARLSAAGVIESKKIELIDEVFDQAKEKILKLPTKEKKKFLEKMLADAGKNIENPKVYVDPSCADLVSGEERELGDFGFVLEDGEGKVRVDCTLTRRLPYIKPSLEPKIASILFGDLP